MWHSSRSVELPALQLLGKSLILGATTYGLRDWDWNKPKRNFLVSENIKPVEVGTKYEDGLQRILSQSTVAEVPPAPHSNFYPIPYWRPHKNDHPEDAPLHKHSV